MIKSLLALTLLVTALSVPSFAADKMKMDHMAKCDDATFAMINDAIKKDTDPKMAKDVMKANEEMKMAELSMKDHKMDDCSKHLGMAKMDMMMK
jgi:ABC-type transporter MlaC component